MKYFYQNIPPANQPESTAGQHLWWQARPSSSPAWKVWPLTSHIVALRWLIVPLNADISHPGQKRGRRQPNQSGPQTMHRNWVTAFPPCKWMDSCWPFLSEHETGDTCWVVKVSRPDWRAIVLVSSGSSQALFPVLFIISISIFKGADAGQRWQPF